MVVCLIWVSAFMLCCTPGALGHTLAWLHCAGTQGHCACTASVQQTCSSRGHEPAVAGAMLCLRPRTCRLAVAGTSCSCSPAFEALALVVAPMPVSESAARPASFLASDSAQSAGSVGWPHEAQCSLHRAALQVGMGPGEGLDYRKAT
jgi:hypothetical protein